MNLCRPVRLTCRTRRDLGGGEIVGDVWPLVHAERAGLIDDLEHLDDHSWEVPSLCGEWTVHDVVAHLVDSARTMRLFVACVRLTATDADLSIGDGPEVTGTALSLLLALSRRRVALDDLDGPGVDALASAT
jgi:hypothetical protein